MDFEETMVQPNENEAETSDSLEEDFGLEEEAEPEESLDSLTDDGEGAEEEAEEQEPKKGKQGTGEPGYVQKRISKAVEKAVRETEARLTAQFEAQMAPIRERMIESEAQELVRSRKVADMETAREFVRLRQGMPAAKEASQGDNPPRQANGQFAPKNDRDPAIDARIAMLKHQEAKIKASGGPDVTAEFMKNEDIKEKVIKGEMDFYDVAEYMKKPKKKPPAPMRSPNGASGQNPNAIESMSDEQFARLEKRIKEGARYSLR